MIVVYQIVQIIFLFCGPLVVAVFILVFHHRQRMAMIEKGIAPQPKPPQAHLRRGLLLSFIGGSLILAWVIWLLLHILNI